eukprot:TRINITY_DN4372_c0_g1_i1.p1 TRINITY_DN4372_c0_g1~~TRINITY_DN4372_c0_g1_i1.p1  ORF type:complete len:153 (-),score=23.94 TRINITY_DN4372_c0_g1_i1:49-507(-)
MFTNQKSQPQTETQKVEKNKFKESLMKQKQTDESGLGAGAGGAKSPLVSLFHNKPSVAPKPSVGFNMKTMSQAEVEPLTFQPVLSTSDSGLKRFDFSSLPYTRKVPPKGEVKQNMQLNGAQSSSLLTRDEAPNFVKEPFSKPEPDETSPKAK